MKKIVALAAFAAVISGMAFAKPKKIEINSVADL